MHFAIMKSMFTQAWYLLNSEVASRPAPIMMYFTPPG